MKEQRADLELLFFQHSEVDPEAVNRLLLSQEQDAGTILEVPHAQLPCPCKVCEHFQ